MSPQHEIPFWLSGQIIWMRGLDSTTTSHDVLTSLMGRHASNYTLVERWKGVEKPLDPLTNILQVWTTWAQSQNEVKFIIKPTHRPVSRSLSPCSTRRKRRLKKPQQIEYLLKCMITESELIHDYLTNKRVPPPSPQPQNTKEQIKLLEKIIVINKKLEKHEESLIRLLVLLNKNLEQDKSVILNELDNVTKQSELCSQELDTNSHVLLLTENWMHERKLHLNNLQQQLSLSEIEYEDLLKYIRVHNLLPEIKTNETNDSNSDTGVSSLSSEDSVLSVVI